MASRRKPHTRCAACRMKKFDCLCSDIQILRDSLSIETRVELVIHHREDKRSTNTGRLASLVLSNSAIHLYGVKESPLQPDAFLNNRDFFPLVLTLSENAQELTKDYLRSIRKPVQLIVPDGNWRQASKIPMRVKEFQGLPKVKISSKTISEYKLRFEPKEKGLATFEAIAMCLGLIEGSECEAKLMGLFRKMVARTLQSRGRLS